MLDAIDKFSELDQFANSSIQKNFLAFTKSVKPTYFREMCDFIGALVWYQIKNDVFTQRKLNLREHRAFIHVSSCDLLGRGKDREHRTADEAHSSHNVEVQRPALRRGQNLTGKIYGAENCEKKDNMLIERCEKFHCLSECLGSL